MIQTFVPYRDDLNLGAAYNEAMGLLPADAWAVFLDHDAMPTTPVWHRQLAEAIAFRPDAGAFVGMTNRIAAPWQKCGPDGDDMIAHRNFGESRRRVRSLLDVTDTKGWGGVLFAVSKAAWAEAGGFADGFFCVDHSIFFRLRDIGRRSYLIEGLYVYHVRASSGARMNAPFAANCLCRGPETMPTERIALP